jgi:hypothetical protein
LSQTVVCGATAASAKPRCCCTARALPCKAEVVEGQQAGKRVYREGHLCIATYTYPACRPDGQAPQHGRERVQPLPTRRPLLVWMGATIKGGRFCVQGLPISETHAVSWCAVLMVVMLCAAVRQGTGCGTLKQSKLCWHATFELCAVHPWR